MGDFYEMFYEDAEVASRALGLTLTSRNNGGAAEVPLAGVPVKAAGEYLRRLVQQGYRVSICEQTEDPKLAKGIVRAGSGRDDHARARRSPTTCSTARATIFCARSTASRRSRSASPRRIFPPASFASSSHPADESDSMLARLAPREMSRRAQPERADQSGAAESGEGALVTEREAWEFDAALARDDLARHFGVASLEGLRHRGAGCPALGAAGALLRYMHELQPGGVPHLARPMIERAGRRDAARRDDAPQSGARGVAARRRHRGHAARRARSRRSHPMGARLLRQWLLAPLRDRARIDARLDAVERLAGDPIGRERAPRCARRSARHRASRRAKPRPVAQRRASCARSATRWSDCRRARRARASIAATMRRRRRTTCQLMREHGTAAPISRRDIIGTARRAAAGRHRRRAQHSRRRRRALDEWRVLRDGGKDAIARIQSEERTRTGISSLKVGYNKVFGYFIEVTNTQLAPRARRLPAAADADGRRALRDAGAQGIRGEGAHRGGADRGARARAVRDAAQPGRRRRSRRLQCSRAVHRRARRAVDARRSRGARRRTSSPSSATASISRSSAGAIRWSSG